MYRTVTALIGLILLFTACNANISTEIYLADIDEVTVDEDLIAEVLIGLPGSSEDDCAEYKQRYAKVFQQSTGFKNMEYVRCYKKDYSTLAEYVMEVPIRLVDPDTTPMIDTFEIVRHDDPETGDRNLYIRSKPSALCDVDKLIRDEFYQSLNLTDSSPEVQITNDIRETQTLIVEHIFVNGAPVIHPMSIEMERRDSIRLALSNVTAAWVFKKSCGLQQRVAHVATWATASESAVQE